MEKQINVILSEKDIKKLNKIKEAYDIQKNGETLRILIREEYSNILKYEEMLSKN